jgi:hypothetical protein
MLKNGLIEEIVSMEWNMFGKVVNKGGGVSCQDDYDTFYIIRSSQYLAWNTVMLISYRDDLIEADSVGRNLLSEKYARMMEHIFPSEYEEIKDHLPPLSSEQQQLIECITNIQVEWMEECLSKYPRMEKRSRSFDVEIEAASSTSYKTFLKGELSCYSLQTLKYYYIHVLNLFEKDINMNIRVMSNIANNYGYTSLDHAEISLI